MPFAAKQCFLWLFSRRTMHKVPPPLDEKHSIRYTIYKSSVVLSADEAVICLKGGDLQAETSKFKNIVEITELTNWFSEEWFTNKYIIYLPA